VFVTFYSMRNVFYFPDNSLEVFIVTIDAQGLIDDYQALNLLTEEITDRKGALLLDKEDFYQLTNS
jgi:hypothetical protein